ncbi:MAG: hypothetical protein V9H25_17300 [Candidatus Competibacter sp.]
MRKLLSDSLADGAHERDEFVEIVLPARQLVVAGNEPAQILGPQLGDLVALAGGERRVGGGDLFGGDNGHDRVS